MQSTRKDNSYEKSPHFSGESSSKFFLPLRPPALSSRRGLLVPPPDPAGPSAPASARERAAPALLSDQPAASSALLRPGPHPGLCEGFALRSPAPSASPPRRIGGGVPPPGGGE